LHLYLAIYSGIILCPIASTHLSNIFIVFRWILYQNTLFFHATLCILSLKPIYYINLYFYTALLAQYHFIYIFISLNDKNLKYNLLFFNSLELECTIILVIIIITYVQLNIYISKLNYKLYNNFNEINVKNRVLLDSTLNILIIWNKDCIKYR